MWVRVNITVVEDKRQIKIMEKGLKTHPHVLAV